MRVHAFTSLKISFPVNHRSGYNVHAPAVRLTHSTRAFFPFTSAWIIDKRPYSTARIIINYYVSPPVFAKPDNTPPLYTQNAPLVIIVRTFSRTADVKGGRSIRCQIDIEPRAWVHATQKSARNIPSLQACSLQSVYWNRFCDRECRLVTGYQCAYEDTEMLSRFWTIGVPIRCLKLK